jgi:hypothetical protein
VDGSTKLNETVFRYPLAAGFAFFAAWRTLTLASDIGLLKSTIRGPFHHIAEDSLLEILFTLVAVFPALYAADWLLKSRVLTILISLVALIVVLWLAASDW